MIKFNDYIPLKGQLSIKVENIKTGESFFHYIEKNTIVLIAKRDVVRLLGNDNINQRYLSKMKFGNGGHVSNPADPNYGQALATNETMEDLVNPLITKSLSSVTFDDNLVNNTSSIICEAMLDTSEGNGPSGTQIYSEAGLFTFNETLITAGIKNSGLFAIKNFPILTKTAELRFIFRWTITV
jgi:hypothetical protein